MTRRRVEAMAAILAAVGLVVVLLNATLVDRRPPGLARVSLSAPAGNDDHVAQTITAIDIEFSEPVDRASVEERFRIDPYVGGTFSWDRDTNAIFTPATKLPSATQFTVTLAAGYADKAGNAAQDPATPFVFRSVGPPVVLTAVPDEGTDNVPTTSTMTLTFDRLMDTGSVEAALSVSPSSTFSSAWSGAMVTLTFESPLIFGTTYQLTVGSEAADTDGSHLAALFTTSFRTVSAGLGVKSTVPADGVSGVGIRTQVAVTFDGSIDPTSVDGAIRMTPPVGGGVRVTEEPSETPVTTTPDGSTSPVAGPAGSGSVLVFTPSAPLAPHTTYTVELAPVVREAGDPGQVAAGLTWTFTTGGPTTSAQNQIAFLTARGGVRNVWLMNPDGSNPRQITTELAPVSAFDVGSDGRTIIYAAGSLVRRMRIDGTNLVTITAPQTFEYGPTLSPDGASVLVARRAADGTDDGWWLVPMPGAPASVPPVQVLADGAPPLGSVDLGGDGLTAGSDGSPWSSRAAFDPTGRWLMIVDATALGTLIDLHGKLPAPAGKGLEVQDGLGAPIWDPSRSAFVLVAGGASGRSAYAFKTDGTLEQLFSAAGPAAVTGYGGVATLVAPDGAHVGYAGSSGGVPIAITTGSNLLDRAPAFSPDARTLLFGRAEASDPEQSAGIWLVALDGTDLRQLSRDGADARWLP